MDVDLDAVLDAIPDLVGQWYMDVVARGDAQARSRRGRARETSSMVVGIRT